jgi:hypothetical protein
MPKISAKFRRRNGVPYAIEQFSGKQFRCRHCNKVFEEEQDLDRHLNNVGKANRQVAVAIDTNTPQLNQMVEVHISYLYDTADFLKKRYLKLKKNEIYDRINFTKQSIEQGDIHEY